MTDVVLGFSAVPDVVAEIGDTPIEYVTGLEMMKWASICFWFWHSISAWGRGSIVPTSVSQVGLGNVNSVCVMTSCTPAATPVLTGSQLGAKARMGVTLPTCKTGRLPATTWRRQGAFPLVPERSGTHTALVEAA